MKGCNCIKNKVIERNNIIDPFHLHGLEQAIYILEQLCNGKEKSLVIREMHGDKQLVDMWINFLRHNYWIAFDELTSQWDLTDKGERWIKQIKKSVLRSSLVKQEQDAKVSIF